MRPRRFRALEPAAARAEARLVARAASGDADAFARLLAGYDRPLRALAYRLLEDETAMDDALQEAYLKAYLALPDFGRTSRFGTWLYRITYNTCLDELRRRGRRPTIELERLGSYMRQHGAWWSGWFTQNGTCRFRGLL